MNATPRHRVLLLPGAVMPAELAYGDLVEALGEGVQCLVKDLEVYATAAPPPDYDLDLEIDGVLRFAEDAGLERFHLVGYSGGGAVSTAFAARHPDRLESLALMEPAWIGNEGWSPGERELWRRWEEMLELPPEEQLPAFVAMQLAPGVQPPPPSPGPPPPWMVKRPKGIEALGAAFLAHDLDLEELRSFDRPVYYWLGRESNPHFYAAMAERLRGVFPDFTLDVYDDLHHFKPAHRFEPEQLAMTLQALWSRASSDRDTTTRRRSSMSDTPTVVRKALEALQAHDLDTLRTLLADDVDLVAPGAEARGRDEYLAFARGWLEAFSDLRWTVTDETVVGDVVVVEEIAEGTHDGPLATPDGEVAATGRRIRNRVCEVHRVRDGRIVSTHLYFDQIPVMEQLGLLS